MSVLSPAQAATIASGVYGLRTSSVSEAIERGRRLGSEGLFTVDDSSRFQGRSGMLGCKVLTGFGYIAEGEGQHQGEILVATRGTAIGRDWLSDFNIGMQIGPGGHPVHAGFHEVWKSFAGDLAEFLRGRNPSVIHCVGHSLGGALATLNADYFSNIRAGAVRLYTFGSPRTGALTFSRSLRRRLGAENIHRVHHHADPVPKFPLFPFLHVPADSSGYQLGNGQGGLISVAAHSMADSYVPGVGQDDWAGLEHRCRDELNDARVQSWLDEVAAGSGIIPYGARTLRMIGRALAWVMKKIGSVLIGTLGSVLTAGMTVLDQLAWLLSRGAELSIEVSSYVGTLIVAIFRFLGRTVAAGASLTLSFVRWVLELLYAGLSNMAGMALSLLV